MGRFVHLWKKFWNRLFKVIREFFLIWWNYSLSYATYNLMSWVGFYGKRHDVFVRYSQKKQEWLDEYIESNYADIVTKYEAAEESELLTDSYLVWVFWGQGKNEMPPLVEVCCKQMFAWNLRGGGKIFGFD